MTTSERLPEFHREIVRLRGVGDVEIAGNTIEFLLNGHRWLVIDVTDAPIRQSSPFVLLKDGFRILSFTRPESLANFFNGIYEKDKTEMPKTEKA